MIAAPTTRAEFYGCAIGIPLPGTTGWCVTFEGNPKDRTAPQSRWNGRPVIDAASLAGDGNAYMTLGLYRLGGRRLHADCVAVTGLLCDDLTAAQVQALPLRPTWVLETSLGNHQAVFMFTEPVADLTLLNRMQDALIRKGLSDPGATSPSTRLVRMPFSSNGKTDPPHPCTLINWAPTLRYPPDGIMQGVALVLDLPRPERAERQSVAFDDEPEAKQADVLADIDSALPFLSADNRTDWISGGIALASLGEAGRPRFAKWSRSSTKYRDGDEDRFDTFSPDRTGYAAIFKRAAAAGWRNPRQRQPVDLAALFGAVPTALPPGALLPSPPGAPAAGAVVTAGQDVMPAPSGSEDQLALDFASEVAQRYRWSPGLGWMVWQPPVWARDVGLSRYDAARTLCRAEARTTQTTAEHRRLGSAKTIQAVITLAQADRRLVMSDAAWDADPQALNTPAGLIDLRTGAACDGAEHLPTQCTVVAADFTAASPVFDRFLNAVFQGDAQLIAFVQRVAGYLLTGSTREQVLFFLYGAGANGKSTLVDLLMWLAGSYALKLPASTLMANRNGEAHPTGIAQLRGKRMAVSSELEEGAFFNESLIKELTGDETLTARFMRGDFFSFKQAQKHVIVGNYRPRLRGGDPALARRLVLVPFTATFSAAQRDPDMLAKLKAEGPAVLAWAVRGAVKWHAEGLGIPEVVRSASADYLQAHDDLQLWVDERCDRAGESKASDLYADFRQWKERRGEHAPTQTTWGERLQRLMGIERRKSNGVRYSPISIRPPEWIGPK